MILNRFSQLRGGAAAFLRYRSLIRALWNQYRNVVRQKQLGIGELFSVSKVKRFKNSNTLFIMGGGPSINKLTKDQLDCIKRHDTFGFTNWTMHDLIPTYYMNEFKNRTPELEQCGYQELYNLVKRKEDYSKTAIILRAGETDFSSVKGFCDLGFPFKHVYYALDIPVHGKTQLDFHHSVDFLKKSGLLSSQYLLLNKTASIFRIISFGRALGYTKIVLCGIDLTGDKYFFEDERELYEAKDLLFPVITAHRGSVHKTNDPAHSTGGMVIEDVIQATISSLLAPQGIELYVSSPESGLYPKLDTFRWNEPAQLPVT